ncbi:MAG: chemotaxis protein CheD [Cyanobacteria bacterium]|nr:chemotaxis protein CheD [Cyanobacteriota bacterium]
MSSVEILALGEILVTKTATVVISIPNLGSSMALVFFEPKLHLGAMAHIVLPESTLEDRRPDESPWKYADLAVPELIRLFTAAGGEPKTASIRLVGGAQMFNFGGGGGNLLNVGARNATAIRAALAKNGLMIEDADIGGNKGKKIEFKIATGDILVKPIGADPYYM